MARAYPDPLPRRKRTSSDSAVVARVFKPNLRKRAIQRVYDATLAEAGAEARVAEVVEDKKRGLVAEIARAG